MRKIFKKVTAVLLATALISTSFDFINVLAANTMNINLSVSKVSELKAGDIVDVSIDFSENSEAIGGNIDLQYNSDYFEVVQQDGKDYKKGGIIPDGILLSGNNVIAESKVKLGFASADTKILQGGTFATVKFKVKQDIYGNASFTLTRTKISDIDTNVIPVSFGGPIEVSVPKHLTSISVTPNNVNLVKGATQQLTVSFTPDDTTDSKTVTWTSSDPTVASVDHTGLVTALKTGTATISAKAGNVTATSTVTVSNPITSISFTETEYNVIKNQSLTLTPVLTPTDADQATLNWVSSDPSVASVNHGVVSPLKEGTTTITASFGNISASTTVKVKEIHIDSITIDSSVSEVLKGKTIALSASISPTNTTDDATITWSSDDDTIATVDGNGVVSGLKEGTVTITAQAGSKTDTVSITVKEIHIDSISLNVTTAEILKGENVELIATINPSNTTDDKTITWTTSDEAIATVKDGVVTGMKEGTATITAKAGTKTATTTITVKEIHIDGIEVDTKDLSLLIGETASIKATLTPTNTTDEDKTITWSSDNEKVVTVDQQGNVKAIKEGTATITAKHGSFEAKTKVTVKEIHIDELLMNVTTAELLKDESLQLSVIYKPENTTDNKNITWKSSDDTIATVDQKGNVKAIKEGTVTITATMAGKSVECKLTVIEKHISDETVALTKDLITIKNNQPFDLTSLLKIDTTDTYTVSYKIDDEKIATIKDHTLIPVSTGNTKLNITVESDDKAKVEKTVNVSIVMKEDKIDESINESNTTTDPSDNGVAPSDSSKKDGTSSDSSQKGIGGISTGDATNITLFTLLVMISGGILFVLKKKNELKEKILK